MRLFTVQPISVLEEIERTGKYVCKEELSECLKDDKNFHIAYDWLVTKMEEKIGPRPAGVKYPVWAWHTIDGKNEKPDVFSPNFPFCAEETDLVLLTIEIDDKDVLLSSYGKWHGPLNNSFWHYEDSDEEWERVQNWYDDLPSAEKKRIKHEAWEKDVFDIKDDKYVQATFYELHAKQIVETFKFRLRRHSLTE